MKITLEFLKQKDACKEGLEYFEEYDLEGIDVYDLLNGLNKDNKLRWTNWLLTILLTHDNCIKYIKFSIEIALDDGFDAAFEVAEQLDTAATISDAASLASLLAANDDEALLKIINYGIELLREQEEKHEE